MTEDLFDSFRNLYPAFESILDELEPIDQGQGEGEWVKRSLTSISEKLDLKPFASETSTQPVSNIYKHLYEERRNAIFHAKTSQDPYLPNTWPDIASIQYWRSRLANLYLKLVELRFGISRPKSSASMRNFVFSRYMELGQTPKILVSDDESHDRESSGQIGPLGSNSVDLDDFSYVPPTKTDPHIFYLCAQKQISELVGLDRVSRIVVASTRGELNFSTLLPEPLILSGIDRLEVRVGHRMFNAENPREVFST